MTALSLRATIAFVRSAGRPECGRISAEKHTDKSDNYRKINVLAFRVCTILRHGETTGLSTMADSTDDILSNFDGKSPQRRPAGGRFCRIHRVGFSFVQDDTAIRRVPGFWPCASAVLQ